MSLLEDALTEDVTYWEPKGYSGTAQEFGQPIQIKARWEENEKISVDADGREFTTSETIVRVSEDVKPGGYLFQGNSGVADPHDVDGARTILGWLKSPTLPGDEFLREAML